MTFRSNDIVRIIDPRDRTIGTAIVIEPGAQRTGVCMTWLCADHPMVKAGLCDRWGGALLYFENKTLRIDAASLLSGMDEKTE